MYLPKLIFFKIFVPPLLLTNFMNAFLLLQKFPCQPVTLGGRRFTEITFFSDRTGSPVIVNKLMSEVIQQSKLTCEKGRTHTSKLIDNY